MIDKPGCLTADRLRFLFDYSPETGAFTRKVGIRGSSKGSVVGTIKSNGYLHFAVDFKKYLAHRLAWLYVRGSMPDGDIDHMDGDRKNNAIANLRCVDRSTNLENIKKAKSHNKSTGLLGAYPVDGSSRYCSKIQVRGKTLHLGCFDTAEQAHQAYMQAKAAHHVGYVR